MGNSLTAYAFDPNSPGELKVDVVASNSPEYVQQWVNTSFKEVIHIKPAKEVIPEQTIYVAVIVTGYEINDNGTVNLTGDFALQNPDGTLMFNEKNAFMYKRPITHQKGFVMMNPVINLTLENKDQRGIYIFKAFVKDNICQKTAVGEYTFTLVNK